MLFRPTKKKKKWICLGDGGVVRAARGDDYAYMLRRSSSTQGDDVSSERKHKRVFADEIVIAGNACCI